MKPLRLLGAAGFGTIILYPLYSPTLSNVGDARMHSPAPLTFWALGIIANLFVLAVGGALLWTWISRSRIAPWCRLLLLPFLVAALIEWLHLWLKWFPRVFFIWAFLLTLVLSFVLKRLRPAAWREVSRGVEVVPAGLGVYGLFVVVQLLVLAAWRPTPNLTTSPALSQGSHPRVVWILMDELSWDQVFDHRYSGLQLPNFDSFRQSATGFSDVQPATYETRTAVPSIMLGRVISRVTETRHNVHLDAVQGQPLEPFPASQTPFAVARQQGMTTAVVGWYNPYCSMLAPYLNQCFWTDEALNPGVYVNGDGFLTSVADSWRRYTNAVHPPRHDRTIARLVEDAQNIESRTNTLLAGEQSDFIFVHLPVPHPPGIYNRRTGQFDDSGHRSYIDNLALADKFLGQLMQTLHASDRWNHTSVVICGDHSFRTAFWRPGHFWTKEDQIATQGTFDPRPLLMVHQAGQTTPATVTTAFPLVGVHDILNSLIRGENPQLQ